MAAKAIARTARSRSAEGQTIAALLPPSSRIERARRADSRGPTARPMAVDPVAEMSGTLGWSTISSAIAWPPIRTVDRLAGASLFAAARSNRACTASALNGVFSEGFQTSELPQTRARAAFHDHGATGKLNAVMIPVIPSGCQVSIIL